MSPLPWEPSAETGAHIEPFELLGLRGRLLYVRSAHEAAREILVIYGHHATLERWRALAETLGEFGNVIMPDLPGFGGMDSFYMTGRRATINELARFTAEFIDVNFSKRRVTVVGVSFGFVVATRMLEQRPDLASRIDLLVSIAGFMRRSDFNVPRKEYLIGQLAASLLSTAWASWIARRLFVNEWFVRTAYRHWRRNKLRFAGMPRQEFKRMVEFEAKLWQVNDVRTHWSTFRELLSINNCGRIAVPLWHVYSDSDPYFNNELVAQHMSDTFCCYRSSQVPGRHTPDITGDREAMSVYLPAELQRALSQDPSVVRHLCEWS